MKKYMVVISIGIIASLVINKPVYADYTMDNLNCFTQDYVGLGFSPYVVDIGALQIEKHNNKITTDKYPHKFKTWVKKLYQGDIVRPTQEFGYFINDERDE